MVECLSPRTTAIARKSLSWLRARVSLSFLATLEYPLIFQPELILHQPTGLIYLACSTPSSRVHWTPAVSRLNATGASRDDYVAIYDPKSSAVTRLEVAGFSSTRGLSLHGMDVVPSSTNPSDLFIYLVNHRAPLGDALAQDVGADSVIEIFKTTVGGKTLTYLKTIESPVIITPNDIVGSPDGDSFYFTNDHGEKVGFVSRKPISSGWALINRV